MNLITTKEAQEHFKLSKQFFTFYKRKRIKKYKHNTKKTYIYKPKFKEGREYFWENGRCLWNLERLEQIINR